MTYAPVFSLLVPVCSGEDADAVAPQPTAKVLDVVVERHLLADVGIDARCWFTCGFGADAVHASRLGLEVNQEVFKGTIHPFRIRS